MFAVIHIPDFSLQAVLRHEPALWSCPVAIVDECETPARITQMNGAAQEGGVCGGLTSTQALARCSHLLIKARSVAKEEVASDILQQTAYNFSPRIEATSAGVCTMDLQGLPVLAEGSHPALRQWAEPIVAALARVNLRSHIGIAHTPNLALQAALQANPILIVQDPHHFINGLPVESLEPESNILQILKRWGIRTVGEFTSLQRDKIAERFGSDGLELFRRASTAESRPLHVMAPAAHFSETMEFEIEIESLQPLLFVLRRFVEQLSCRIGLLHLVLAELKLHLKLSSGDTYESTFKVPCPTGNVEVLFRMLQTHLENVRTDSPIVSVTLSGTPSRSEHYQFGLFEAALKDPNQFAETMARLGALCGSENVGSPKLSDTHRPDAFKMERPRFDASESKTTPVNVRSGLRLRRFRPAFHADVEMTGGKPAFIASLKLNASIQNVSGPWRSSGDWWELEKRWNRDEWDIQMRDGSLYRIYHENQDWFIEGVYD